jgi:hypothetical protein
MAPGRTSSGRFRINTALEPRAYELLRQMAGRERGVGTLLGNLIEAEAQRRAIEEGPRQPQEKSGVGQGHPAHGAALELARRESALRKANEHLALLHEIDRAILAAQSPGDIASAAAQGLLHATDAVRVVVAI